MMRRLISLFLVMVLTAVLLPHMDSAAQTQALTIENRHMRFSVNEDTGFFSIRTLEGHPQKARDDNINLLYEGTGFETSFVTVRIDDRDYIFGQDYGFLGRRTSREPSVVNLVTNQITTKWTIDDIEITQLATLSHADNTVTTGNIGLTYSVNNKSGAAHDIGIRVMLDTALASNDAPIVIASDKYACENGEVTLYKEENVAAGRRAYPSAIRFVDDLNAPSMGAFVSYRGWPTETPPDEVKIGHWSGLAAGKWDYTTDSQLLFGTGFNKYQTADTAFATYWEPKNVANGDDFTVEMLYGIGDFSVELQKSAFNVGIRTNGKLEANAEKTAYINDTFDLEVTIDNSVDNSRDLIGPTVSVMFDQDLTIQSGIDGYETRETFTTGLIRQGSTYTFKYRLKATPLQEMKALSMIVVVQENLEGGEAVSTKRYIVAPSLTGAFPKFKITDVSPMRLHMEGPKTLSIMGDFSTTTLSNRGLWDTALRNTVTKEIISIKSDDVIIADQNKLILRLADEMPVGEYEIVFAFTGEYEEAFAKEITAGKNISIVNDPKLMGKTYSVLAIYGENNQGVSAKYLYQAFESEGEFEAFAESLTDSDELLMEIRGAIYPIYNNEGKVTSYGANASNDSIIINKILSYRSEKPMLIRKEGDKLLVEGDGKIAVVGASSIWQWGWRIVLQDTFAYSLEDESIKLDFYDLGKVMSVISGFLFDFKYGVFGREENGYTVNFGGKMTLGFLGGTAGDSGETPGTSTDGPGAGKVSSGAGDAGGDDDDGEIELPTAIDEEKGGKLVIAIDDALFGEKGEEVSPGFIGINTTAEFKMPKECIGGVLKEGFEASLTINTIDHIYRIGGKVNIYIVECEAELIIKLIDKATGYPIPLPDTLFFAAGSEQGVPIVPGLLDLTKLGGGYSGLADSVNEGVDALPFPPIAIRMVAGLKFISALIAEGDVTLSPGYFSFDVEFRPPAMEFIKLQTSLYAQWTDPYELMGAVELNIAGIIKGGGSLQMSITGSGEVYFGAVVYAGIYIPGTVPIIGGKSFVGAEVNVNTDFVGASVEFLGVDVGVRYLWGDGDVDIISPFALDLQGGQASDDVMISLSNVRRLQPQQLQSQQSQMSPMRLGRAVAYSSSVTNNFTTNDDEDVILQIPFYGSAPDISDLEFTIDDQPTVLSQPNSGYQGGNCIIEYSKYEENGEIKQKNNEGQIIISIKNPGTATAKYLLGIKQDAGISTMLVNMEAIAVKSQGKMLTAEVGGGQNISNPVDNEFALSITADKSLEGDSIIAYLIEDGNMFKNITTKIETDENGNPLTDENGDIVVTILKDGQPVEGDLIDPTQIGQTIYNGVVETSDTSFNVQARFYDTLPSGTYYVHTVRTSPTGAVDSYTSQYTVTYDNPNEPNPIKSATLRSIGDGRFAIDLEQADDANYTNYSVSIYNVTEKKYEQDYTAIPYSRTEGVDTIIVNGFNGNMLTSSLNADGTIASVDEIKSSSLKEEDEYRADIKTLITRGEARYFSSTVQSTNAILKKVNKPEITGEMKTQYLQKDIDGTTKNFIASNRIVYEVTSNVPVTGDFYIDGLLYASTGAEADYKWNLDISLQDGEHTIYFLGANEDGDTSTTEYFGFSIVSTPPSIKLDSNVYHTEDGNITIRGISEKDNKLYFEEEECAMEADGSFVIVKTGLLPTDYSEEYSLRVESLSGKVTHTTITIVNDKIEPINGIAIKVEPADELSEDGLKMVIGEVVKLTVEGETDGVSRIAKDAEMTLMDGFGSVSLSSDGTLEALNGGMALIKASYTVGAYQSGETESTIMRYEDILMVEVQPQADTPIASLPSGGTVVEGTELELYSGQNIYYTLDGSTPTVSSTRYTEPIILDTIGNITIKAISIQEGYADSGIMTVSYNVVEDGEEPGGEEPGGEEPGGEEPGGEEPGGEEPGGEEPGGEEPGGEEPGGEEPGGEEPGGEEPGGEEPGGEEPGGEKPDPVSTPKPPVYRPTASSSGYFVAAADTNWRTYPGEFYGQNGSPGMPVDPEASWSPIYPPVSGSSLKYGTVIQFETNIPGGVVYYTLDGTTPNKDSLRCDGNITITENTVLKVVVWREGDVYTKVLTLSYLMEPYMTKFKQDAANEKFVRGYEDGTFKPDNQLTRAESVAMLSRVVDMYGYFVRDGMFNDADMWAKDDINKFAGADILKGYEDGGFHPDRSISRAEFLTVIIRILGISEKKELPNSDASGHWAESALAKALEYGIIEGYEDGSVRPDGQLTRAEAVVMLSRLLNIEKVERIQNIFSDIDGHWACDYILSAAEI